MRIGISGWRYAPWRGVFYPRALPQRAELAHASRIFNTIEINGTHYKLQRREFFEQWRDAAPPGFIFAVKGSRYITHMLQLKNAEAGLARFFASGLLALGPKLGPILWQLSPRFKFNPAKLESFFKLLPRDGASAAALAAEASGRPPARSAVADRSACGQIRHALEIRHDSFKTPEFVDLLRAHDVALVCADTVEWPRLMDLTSDFVYCRLHGSQVLYVSGYAEAALQAWARRVAAWAQGREPADAERILDKPAPRRATRDVFVYFDNDAKVRAPFDAQRLAALVRAELG